MTLLPFNDFKEISVVRFRIVENGKKTLWEVKKNGSVREKMHSIGLIIGLLCGWNSKYVLSLHLSGNHSVNWKKDESSLVDKMQIRLIFKSHYESTTDPSQEKSMPQYSITNKKVHFFPNVSIIQSDFISESHIQMVEMAF